jgi:catechol 2,3-dioxygenase-like lactoylglutathione lyase family enzyme
MKSRALVVGAACLMAVLGAPGQVQTRQAAPGVSPAHFHHVHLNSVDPAAAAEYYSKPFTSASRTTFGGYDAVKTGNIYLLFTKVTTPPPTQPQSAVWHFGWNTPDSRQYMDKFRALKLEIAPMVSAYDGGLVDMSSDALPGYLTKAQIDEARTKGVQPSRSGGFGYLRGPDGVLIENAGNFPVERFNHVHLFHRDPLCAILWYASHLGGSTGGRGVAATPSDCRRPYSEPTWLAFAKEGMVREPSGNVLFDDISLSMRPWPAAPLVSSRGQVVDHIALSVGDLDATVARLRSEGVRILEPPHPWAGTRAAMIEGPDLLAIELVEVK